jgi:ATP-dependent DNA helicase DinG
VDAFDRLASVIPGYEHREEQLALARAVERALADEEHLLAQAGTGTGKSLAYLVPALQSGRRVVVATATKALQEQLVTKDVPLAEAALGRKVRAAVVKGRQNYVCRRRVEAVELGGLGLLGDEAAYERLLPWIGTTKTGDRAELDEEPPPALWSELAVGSDRCLGRRCPRVATCFAEAARTRAAQADLVIANHALYFADLALRESGDGARVLPDHDAVVFDEAHKLEETAASWLGARITVAAVRRLATDAAQAASEARVRLPPRAEARVEAAAEDLLRDVAPRSGRRRLRALPRERALVLIDELERIAQALWGRSDELDAVAARARKLAGDVATCLEPPTPNLVVWSEPGLLAYAPVDVSERLSDSLWSEGPTAILVSATLEHRFVGRRLGLEHADRFDAESPFDFRTQALLYVPRRLAEPRDEAVAAQVEQLCRLSRGRALVLTTSYRMLGTIASHLRDRLSYEVLVQGEAPRERLLERFRDDTDSVLVATATFWQGVDVAGESLSLLVMDKLPFASPGDPLTEARCERIVERGGDWFDDYALPVATLQLRQGFGRLVRGHGDRGVAAILDPRIYTRAYGQHLLDSLPPCPLVDDLTDVERFFADDAVSAGRPLARTAPT